MSDGDGGDHRRWWRDEATVTTALVAVLLLGAAACGLVAGWDDGALYALAGFGAVMVARAVRSIRQHR